MSQLNRERNILRRRPSCKSQPVIGKTLDDIVPELVNSADERFYDGELIHYIECTFNRYLKTAKLPGLIQGTKRIGSDSANGSAFLAKLKKSIKEMFVVKVPQTPYTEATDWLLHEYFVGAMVTNKFRAEIPNYAVLFGMFECGHPIMKSGKIKLCPSLKEYRKYENGRAKKLPISPYIVYEKILGKSLRDALPTLTQEAFVSTFSQIFLALQYGVNLAGFTHYDLHADNVILRDIQQAGKVWIKYPLPDASAVWIKANKVATFIDFGRSHVTFDGTSYGFSTKYAPSVGVFNEPRPLHDVLKVIGVAAVLLRKTLEENPADTVVQQNLFQTRRWLTFFYANPDFEQDPNSTWDQIELRTDSANVNLGIGLVDERYRRYRLTRAEQKGVDLFAFIQHFIAETPNLPDVWSYEKQTPVLDCTSFDCPVITENAQKMQNRISFLDAALGTCDVGDSKRARTALFEEIPLMLENLEKDRMRLCAETGNIAKRVMSEFPTKLKLPKQLELANEIRFTQHTLLCKLEELAIVLQMTEILERRLNRGSRKIVYCENLALLRDAQKKLHRLKRKIEKGI